MLKRVAFVVAIVTATSLAGAERAAAATIYTTEAAFIAGSGALSFESFEGLLATNSVTPAFVATLADFTLTASPTAGVFNFLNYFGTHATHGVNYIEVEGGGQQTMTFTFAVPVVEFGITITDYGDIIGGPLTFVTNTGANGTAVTGARPDANDQFFGLIDAANPFTSVTFSTAIGPFGDPFSVDRIYSTQRATAVPEPTLVALLAAGFGTAFSVRRARRI
jgi:hypothetical protein